MSLAPLDNPLERLGVNPNGMNWRGLWDATEQYYLNDVVISPATTASYILSGPTTLLGGADPSLNVDWTELSNPTTGVVSVSGSTYINVVGTTNPQIFNTGVQTLGTGTGITNIGTANQPVLINSGITSLSAGLGISVVGNQITNEGIRTLAVNTAGLTTSGGNNPTLTNTGVISVGAGSGISVSVGQTPTITNTGLLGLTAANAGAGVSIGGTPTAPLISVSATQPILSNIFAAINIVPVPASVPCPAGGTLVYATILSGPSLFNTQLATTGSPDPNGIWLVDMANFDVYLYGPPAIGLARNLSISFVDTATTGGPYSYIPTGTSTIQFYPNQPLPINTDMGSFVFDITAARVAGLRTITEVHIFNNTNATLVPQGWGNVYASYYPNGVQ